jgi:hypothetical protein
MGSKRFDTLSDFSRWGMNIRLECGNGRCDHFGIVDAWAASTYFRLRRWSESLDAGLGESALHHFRCSRCGHKAGRARPDANAVTVINFFPADERGWQMMQRRLRG